jgi:NADH pyrophosphatase NudC (nudix superfamily)
VINIDKTETTWIRYIKRTENGGRRRMYQCAVCGYKSRTKSRFCGGCGRPAMKGETEQVKKKSENPDFP